MNQFDHETYLSPLSWRYGSEEMRAIWSEARKRRLFRRFWVALAQAQQEAGLVRPEQVAELRLNQERIDIDRSEEIEAEIGHDLVAEIKTFAEQSPLAAGIIHLGATSTDVEDNVDALRLRHALVLIVTRLEALLSALAARIEQEAAVPSIAFTHIQPAEPTTVGYRLAQYAQDLLEDWRELCHLRDGIRGKGLKGAVGSSASYVQLLEESDWDARRLEDRVMELLDLTAYPVTTQTYPRKQDWRILNGLSGLAASLHKFAFDLRILQSPPIGEWSEPFGSRQVGSSAMPFKRNPVVAENINSLARYLAALPRIAWDNAALSLLERTLDDSANRRLLLPQAFLTADTILIRTLKIVQGLQIRTRPSARNLRDYGIFAATERVLMVATRRGGNRQEIHELIRRHALQAWAELQAGHPNPLARLLAQDATITALINQSELEGLLDVSMYIGNTAESARGLAGTIVETITNRQNETSSVGSGED